MVPSNQFSMLGMFKACVWLDFLTLKILGVKQVLSCLVLTYTEARLSGDKLGD